MYSCPICSSPLRFIGKRKKLDSTVEGELYWCCVCHSWWIKWNDVEELKRLFIPAVLKARQ
jgi:hypothetical protein